ncbi:isoprenylcysteine carboxyl methyltransferase family protein [Cytobacillus sp. Hz8]|uniref:isoprenylcysteine carboxyl methyltransferase family protein n=1 Tax=Cytobacillus sp. Hz8 TaxID=3347168 RepID=UPI0035DB505E
MIFVCFLLVLLIQRGIELILARKNEIYLKNLGAIELGRRHYPVIVAVHGLFFVSLSLEVYFYQKEISNIWPYILTFFLLTQSIRIWVIKSLGPFWNTKIIVLPQATVMKGGPYQLIKHPNYVVVSLEFILIPFLFNAYLTAILFSFLNAMILSIRIPAEENALRKWTEYEVEFSAKSRFLPSLLKKI